ncbi:MAG: hypothetical protein OEX02_15680, partial [Cyclobacteriaceae bacterium]|nr:hypothetical protein [Cyclobacteriaceae bacterium]
MIKIKQILLIALLCSGPLAMTQNMGISFSFFFPKNGELSMPVSPFSYRGVALPFSDYLGVQTGITVYRMPGLNIKGLPFESQKPLYGPNFTGYVPLELYFQMGSKSATFTMKGGVFGFYSVFNKLNYGNLDRQIRDYEQWAVANADLKFTNKPGWGYQGGVELLVPVNRQFSLTFEVNYLSGYSKLNLEGAYTGGNMAGALQTRNVSWPDAKVDLTGL